MLSIYVDGSSVGGCNPLAGDGFSSDENNRSVYFFNNLYSKNMRVRKDRMVQSHGGMYNQAAQAVNHFASLYCFSVGNCLTVIFIKLERLKFVLRLNHFALKSKIYFVALKNT
jgi:hypothetical protein